MRPTPYGELNVLLAELTGRARQILGARFVAAYLQGSFAVTTACRILYTLETAQVASKRASLRWAMDHLEPSWQPLLQQVLEDRALGWDPEARPRPGSVELTRAFVARAQERLTTQG